MLKVGASVVCFILMALGFFLLVRNRYMGAQKTAREDPAGFWLLIGLGLMGGIVFAVL